MATLYEINEKMSECFDAETGEILDIEKLTALQMEAEDKIENAALWVKNLNSDIAAYKAEEDAFAKRRKVAENKVKALKNWLSLALEGRKFQTAKCAVSFRRSEAVEILDVEALPEAYIRKTLKVEPDKDLIKQCIKAGMTVAGAELRENQSVQIK